jgi:hypothetical protein
MQDLARIALVGTANHPGDIPAAPEEFGTLIPATSREQQLLLQAGAFAVYRDAGRMTHRLPMPAPAPDETLSEVPRSLMPVLNAAIGGDLTQMAEWLAPRIARAGYRLPAVFLPAVFIQPERLQLWHATIGQRGHWLAAKHPEWQARLQGLISTARSDGDLQRDWEEGNAAQRGNALAELRMRDPARGRTWIAAVLPKEKADLRQAFVEKLIHGLGPDDEALLEGLLDDRSQAVRLAAADLLARLPGSAYAARMCERADTCVHWQSAAPTQGMLAKVTSLLGNRATPSLKITIPQELPKEWERDGISPNPPHGQGKRAFWLRQLISSVPPSYWSERAEAGPDVLVSVMEADEWADALVTGCAEASVRHADPHWSAVLFARAVGSSVALTPFQNALWPILLPEARDALVCQQLELGNATTALHYLRKLPGPWPGVVVETLSRAVLADGRGRRTPDEVMQRYDLAELVALAVVRASDADFTRLAPLIALYAEKTGENPANQDRVFNLGRQIVAMAQAKQTVIKEMPL